MRKFTDAVNQDTPRLVVEFQYDDSNQEQIKWGVVGNMPVLTLVGFVERVQAELAFRKPEECDYMALVIAWDADEKIFRYFVNPQIPVDPLVGMLETIKVVLVDSQRAKVAQQQSRLFGPDGSMYRR